MSVVTIHQAKTHLSQLLKRVSAGEEIIIAHGKMPIARLSRFQEKPVERKFGEDRGKVWIAEDFNAPLPKKFLKHFLK